MTNSARYWRKGKVDQLPIGPITFQLRVHSHVMWILQRIYHRFYSAAKSTANGADSILQIDNVWINP